MHAAGTGAVVRSVLDYNGIASCSSLDCAKQNGYAFVDAARAAAPGDIVLFDQGQTFFFLPPPEEESVLTNLQSLTLDIGGTLVLHDDFTAWPMSSEKVYVNAIDIRNSSRILITGSGQIDGQGETWWVAFGNGEIPRERPTMIYFEGVSDSTIERVSLFNAPRFNIYGADVERFTVRYMTIWVNVSLQHDIMKDIQAAAAGDLGHQAFPFNTDGVDFKGRDIHVHDLSVSNYDDVIAVKPSDTRLSIQCTENVLVERISILGGVGLSIGSVPPSIYVRCIRNVTFRDSTAKDPIKLIHIKSESEPADEPDATTVRSALIESIVYSNITATGSVMWPIYLGPQQQNEPDGTGEGWFDVPIDDRVTIRNISFLDVTVTGNHVKAGLIRCNSSNPCLGISFDNVRIQGGMSEMSGGFICDERHAAFGTYDRDTSPSPSKCLGVPR